MISQTEAPACSTGLVVPPVQKPAIQKEDRESRADLIRDSLGYLASKVIPGFFGLISVPVFVRLIGLEEYGRLAVILPVLMALGGAGAGWLQQGILRFHSASGASSAEGSAFDHAVERGTIYAVLTLSGAVLAVLAVMHSRLIVWVVAEAYCVIQLIYSISLTRFQAQLKPRTVLWNEALRSTAGFILPLALVLTLRQQGFSLILAGLALGYLLPLFFNGGANPLKAPHSPGARADSETMSMLGRLWRFGWAVGVWLMLCQALPVAGRTAIERYCGYAQAGVYASLYEIAVRSFSLLASPVMQAAHPRIMRCWNTGDYSAARTLIWQSIRIQVLLFLPFEAVGIAFAGPLTRLILGSAHSAPVAFLPLLMLGGFCWQIALLVHKPLEIMQRTRTMLCGMLGVVLIEVAGNYLFVPRYGMQSAVYVFVFGSMAYIAFAACYWKLSRQPASGSLDAAAA